MASTLFDRVYQHPLITLSDIQEIVSLHKKLMVPKGDFLLKKGKTADAYYLVEKGLVRFFVHDFNGNEITTQFICENEIVNEVSSLFQRIPSVQNIQAVTNTVVWEIVLNDFQHLYHTLESVREWGREWMSAQLFQSQLRSIEMITQSASSRYLQLMEQRPQIIHQAPLKQIASYLGIADSSLSRIRKEIFNG
ncbi:Crp/Fnr family transcriptional regulator [Zobellia galactanivorans]|uniref:Crp/Fnr family transcriptional regulator n=1 Tax=Zobellia galactanivorans (strain DSM 12802 / CCUG 47099 / CIP 106680 / NCIMB 13871 / Dsij) TaxID=63186 RepID=UPI001C0672B4|nr:Crp/Fnr family transcriptional regulator [Zobellia galactanivorans]MBU3026381.1 Crp/Fnr family transcriptional regulator [Zobellia galactanivorans]